MPVHTICAVATPEGRGGIAIVRMSGPETRRALENVFVPARAGLAYEPWRMMYGAAVEADGEVIDEVLAVWMPGPRSYTREDVAEIHCHGGAICARRIVDRLMALGLAPAAPGEFTKRAFLNGRIDLSRAEAVMELIGAQSQAAQRASMRQLEGGVSGFVRDVSAQLLEVLALIEASTDFPDEVEEEAAADETARRIRSILDQIRRRCDPRSARLLREGASIVLAGRPNVGKSSLMNALLEQDRAIVTEVPGTTRDVLTERLSLGGILAELSDTAGQRATEDPVERIGVDRAKGAADAADVLLVVLDASQPLTDEDRSLLNAQTRQTIICLNKCDLPQAVDERDIKALIDAPVMKMCARSGEGVGALKRMLEERLRTQTNEDALTVQRHIALAQRASASLANALGTLEDGMPLDVVSIDLKEALGVLSQINAADPSEALLDEIFSRFCVGK